MDAEGCWGLRGMFVIVFAVKMNAFPMIGITIVQDAVAKGAVCLDGTPPAYHLDRGFGSGANSWLVQVEGGAWCNNITSCFARKSTPYGSSTYMAPELPFSGILSNNESYNPDFYNWNRVKVRYCDGASFTGDVEEVDPSYNLYYRGARIFAAIIEDLLAKGLNRAEYALLSGCSAGGLTSILHCDKFRSLLPASAQVKCLADAGYFINVLDVIGTKRIETFYSEVVSLHGSEKNLLSSCTSRMTPSLCFFPQYVVDQIETPIFILNAAYDAWQIQNSLVPGVAVPHGTWYICKANISNCSQAQLGTLQEFRQNFLNAIERVRSDTGSGMFINSCYADCQLSSKKHGWGVTLQSLTTRRFQRLSGTGTTDGIHLERLIVHFLATLLVTTLSGDNCLLQHSWFLIPFIQPCT